MADLRRVSLDEVVVHFQELEDPRSAVNQRHPLVSVLVIALLAVLAGAGGPTAIAPWAAPKEEFLLRALDLPNGVPRKDVFRRVLMALKPAAFQACFADWLRSLRTEATAATGVEQPTLAVDGKAARRSHDRAKGLGALHAVSVWASEYCLSFVARLLRRRRQTGSLDPESHGGGHPPALDPAGRERLHDLVRQKPDATLDELRQRIGIPCRRMAL
jgi:hypothetical protein